MYEKETKALHDIGLRFKCELADVSEERCESFPNGTHWKCTIQLGRSRMSTTFSQGSAYAREPNMAEVVGCLIMDAQCYENAGTFESFVRDLGYMQPPDPYAYPKRKYDPLAEYKRARRAFLGCKRMHTKLHTVLGADFDKVAAIVGDL